MVFNLFLHLNWKVNQMSKSVPNEFEDVMNIGNSYSALSKERKLVGVVFTGD